MAAIISVFLAVIIILLVIILIKISRNNDIKNIINTSLNVNNSNLIDNDAVSIIDINTNLKFDLIDIKTELENKKLMENLSIFEINKNDKSLTPITDTLTKLGSESIITLLQSSQISKLYKATVDPNTLMKLNSGGIGSAVIDKVSGKITDQAGFISANPASIIGPQAVFAVLSIVVGQHYMSEISSNLSNISDILDKILQHFKNEHESKLEAATEKLITISNLQYVGIEDIINLNNLEDSINEIYHFYKKELKNFNVDNINTDKFLYKSKLKDLDYRLNKELKNAEYSYKICTYSKELLNMIKLIKYNSYLKMEKVDMNAVNKANQLLDEIKQFTEDIFFNEKENPKELYIKAISNAKDKLFTIYRDNTLLDTKEDFLLFIDEIMNTNFWNKCVEDNPYYNYSKIYDSKREELEKNKDISISYNKSKEMLKKFDSPINTYYFTKDGHEYFIAANE
ncbi:hypothetical protein [Brachyspira hampsonii]|uniref:hypothetical protein n=1 Tax=Brachyspira hampsonii TaxID=1287055 RepID=UPI000D382B43|nr:hypothetical protein [Brachyspira hampsonii]PTY40998.1 hypothetical protein DQ06_10795 [Brachyspira hampsonii bv. II]